MNCTTPGCGHTRERHARHRTEGKPAVVLGGCNACGCENFGVNPPIKRATINDDIRRIEREIRSLNAQVQDLKQRAASQE